MLPSKEADWQERRQNFGVRDTGRRWIRVAGDTADEVGRARGHQPDACDHDIAMQAQSNAFRVVLREEGLPNVASSVDLHLQGQLAKAWDCTCMAMSSSGHIRLHAMH